MTIIGAPPTVRDESMDQAPHRLVGVLEKRLRGLEVDFHRAYWESQTSASPESERRRAELELELRRVKGDPRVLAAVKAALDEPLHDAVLRRQLEVLRLSLSANQMSEEQRARIVDLSSAIENEFASYRAVVDGRTLSDNDIDAILTSSDDSVERESAWRASKAIGALVAERVIELVRERNRVARALGWSDHYAMSLELQELTEAAVVELLDQLDCLTAAPFERWKALLDERLGSRFGVRELQPWHYDDPFFQSLPRDGRPSLDGLLSGTSAETLSVQTFARWGIDLTAVMSRSDLYPRPGKSQHAFCLDVDRTGADVRILANVAPGERWVEVMLHESGHAAYDVSIDPNVPYLLHRPAHTFVTEAIAIMTGRLAREPGWLRGVALAPTRDVDEIADGLERAAVDQSLVFARWGLVMVHFERALYADPEQDLDARWWELVERFQLVRAPGRRSGGEWAAKVHVSTTPVYYHNYLLGEVLASQLRATCERLFGGFVGVPEAGRFLAESLFKGGALMPWNQLVEAVTGRRLSVEDVAAPVAA